MVFRLAGLSAGCASIQEQSATVIAGTGLTKGLKGAIEEDLRRNAGSENLVAGDVPGAPRGKFTQFFPTRHVGVVPESERGRKMEDGTQGKERELRVEDGLWTGFVSFCVPA